ncbi:MAG TPA: hypothetical protein VND64_35745 [Pirellulales bacterium]|nr:hypothetical protein [Pirellulales bacterium]
MAAAVGGCAGKRAHGVTACKVRSLDALFPPTELKDLEFDDRGVGELSEVERLLGLHRRPGYEYFELSAPECQCRAAAASTEGNSLAAERRSIEAKENHHGLSESELLKIRILRASELEARNKSSGVAMDVYYHLAEALANRYVLIASIEETESALKKVDRMRKEGVAIPFDDGEIWRKWLELTQKQVALELQTNQLNVQLVRLLGLPTTEPHLRFWPTTDWQVVVEPIDMATAVAVGLATRPEIRLLESLPADLNKKTVSVVKVLLAGGSGGLLGSDVKASSLISIFGIREMLSKACDNKKELPVRQRQLAEYTEQRRQDVTSEIQLAVLTVETRLREIAVMKKTSQAWEHRNDQLQKQRRIEEATFADLTAAKLKTFQAESDEIGRVVAWKIALAKLKEAQGRLIEECSGTCFPR